MGGAYCIFIYKWQAFFYALIYKLRKWWVYAKKNLKRNIRFRRYFLKRIKLTIMLDGVGQFRAWSSNEVTYSSSIFSRAETVLPFRNWIKAVLAVEGHFKIKHFNILQYGGRMFWDNVLYFQIHTNWICRAWHVQKTSGSFKDTCPF